MCALLVRVDRVHYCSIILEWTLSRRWLNDLTRYYLCQVSSHNRHILFHFFFFLIIRPPQKSPLFPYPPLSRPQSSSPGSARVPRYCATGARTSCFPPPPAGWVPRSTAVTSAFARTGVIRPDPRDPSPLRVDE